ncbi:NUDIX hydrolase [Rummeliibacillus stabekisii]|uniref:Nudix hydrolase domain-containing protein n=1 Tax=Rummeliibacillus stabekisii TaxID=241244 RepID=A0A143HEH3_9BACL|nr:NUDIX domain-containing protein [Rummeliibacillus stabekisii]AMW99839.1 hypothetical protein ATY39_10540 [Rummeliibacillus stabekisii]
MILVVSVSIIKDKELLMIEEKRDSGINQWNFPSGRIEKNEDIMVAAIREVKEETGLDVELLLTTGVYNFTSDSSDQVILFHFIGEIVSGEVSISEEAITNFKWVHSKGILAMPDDTLRNSKVIRQITKNIVNRNFYSTALFNRDLLTQS